MTTIRPSTTRAVAAKPSTDPKRVNITDLGVGDRGLKVKLDAKTNSVKIAGLARGIEARSPWNPDETDPYLQTEQFGGGMSLSLDMDRMPKFDTSRGYTEKNKWYFAHSISIGTQKGQTPVQVARNLAAKINESADYTAKVKVAANGSALVEISRD